jgi:phage/plasmid-associated DNA primase
VLGDDETPHHPHWDKILRHCGQDLDAAIRSSEWATRANIKSGADYLLYWIACMLQDVFEPLPYLFFYGDQNSGKSIFHEAVSLLMTKGVAAADRALTNANDFNGELANAVLCYVEEKDISVAGAAAYNKIKDWVTSKMISIRKMRTDSYSQRNTTHWVQCANNREACPIFPGDTRITMVFVPDLARRPRDS